MLTDKSIWTRFIHYVLGFQREDLLVCSFSYLHLGITNSYFMILSKYNLLFLRIQFVNPD